MYVGIYDCVARSLTYDEAKIQVDSWYTFRVMCKNEKSDNPQIDLFVSSCHVASNGDCIEWTSKS